MYRLSIRLFVPDWFLNDNMRAKSLTVTRCDVQVYLMGIQQRFDHDDFPDNSYQSYDQLSTLLTEVIYRIISILEFELTK